MYIHTYMFVLSRKYRDSRIYGIFIFPVINAYLAFFSVKEKPSLFFIKVRIKSYKYNTEWFKSFGQPCMFKKCVCVWLSDVWFLLCDVLHFFPSFAECNNFCNTELPFQCGADDCRCLADSHYCDGEAECAVDLPILSDEPPTCGMFPFDWTFLAFILYNFKNYF